MNTDTTFSPVTVRPARSEDRDSVWPLARDFATSFTVDRDAFNGLFATLHDTPIALLLVATTTEAVVGYLLAHVHDAFLANGPITWVEEVMVDPQHRATGIGRALMAAAEAWAHDTGSAYVALASRRAGGFYTALGYSDSATFYKKTLAPRPAAARQRRIVSDAATAECDPQQ